MLGFQDNQDPKASRPSLDLKERRVPMARRVDQAGRGRRESKEIRVEKESAETRDSKAPEA